jgi:hypothetical protein
MSVVGLLVAVGILVAVAVLALLYGVDTRPTAADRREVWFGHRC